MGKKKRHLGLWGTREYKSDVKKLYDITAPKYELERYGGKCGNYILKLNQFKFLKYIKGPLVLELGMGPGTHGFFLMKSGFNYYGIDFAEEMVRIARERVKKEKLKMNLFLMDVESLGFANNTFDSLLCDKTIKFLKPSKALKEAYRVLKPGGTILICAEAPNWTARLPLKSEPPALEKSCGFPKLRMRKSRASFLGSKLYTIKELSTLLENAGFEVIGRESLHNFPMFLVYVLPNAILRYLLLIDVNSKYGIIGSKVLVVGKKPLT